MGCLLSTQKQNHKSNTLVEPVPNTIESKDNNTIKYSENDLSNKRSWPELVGKNKEYVKSYFEFNYPKLIVKFDNDVVNPYLTNETYERYDILVIVKNNIVIETPAL